MADGESPVEDMVTGATCEIDPQSSFRGSFSGKRVIVTGHTGFKGAWLSLWLNAIGASVMGYALEPPTVPSAFEAVHLDAHIDSCVGDIRDFDHLLRVLSEFQPHVVFHLAAQPLVRPSYAEPRMTYETNVMGTINLLEGVRQTPSVKAVVVVTSDKCYQNQEWDYAYRENDPLGGRDPYSSSKGCSEIVTAAYRSSFFLAPGAPVVASARAGNVVGGGDWALDRLLPDCVRALQSSQVIRIRNPKAVRPWQHVLEPLAGYLTLASEALGGNRGLAGAWNFGPRPQDHITVGDMVSRVIDTWGAGEWASEQQTSGPSHEARLLRLDCTKATNLLGWHPVYDIGETLDATVKWYKRFYDGQTDMYSYSIQDILRFVRRASSQGLGWTKAGGR